MLLDVRLRRRNAKSEHVFLDELKIFALPASGLIRGGGSLTVVGSDEHRSEPLLAGAMTSMIHW